MCLASDLMAVGWFCCFVSLAYVGGLLSFLGFLHFLARRLFPFPPPLSLDTHIHTLSLSSLSLSSADDRCCCLASQVVRLPGKT